ncbi:hypothetical protein KI387_042395 [Taxus chinensis]|uniref:histidine kinase n=1 Tax=Taxus chinensis TaxID=29808 RepID=A0AA38F8C6_TAXCH|nr:hypothetical protein KI387_042395 [Taxus chinensis]
MAASKICTALVSCATALTLVHIIPDLLSVKTRELYLKNKAAELDREMGAMRTQEEIGRHVRMLTHEIRSTLDRHTILNKTLFELGRTLDLEECTLWMPTRTGLELQLSHSFRHGQNIHTIPVTVPIHHPSIKHVFSSDRALEISSDSPVVTIRPQRGRYMQGNAAAVRVPLLHLANLHTDEWPEPSTRSYVLMVLTTPYDSARRWHEHELELVNVVADQVAVALSHATVLEESVRAHRLLMEQNVELTIARQKAETEIHACNDSLVVMNHEMQMPMHAIIALSSLLQETELTLEHRCMVRTILRSSDTLNTLINDVLELSRLEDGSLQLEMQTFSLPELFGEILKLFKPIASVKKLSFSINLSSDLPGYAVGDSKRLMQITLNLVANAMKFTSKGSIHVMVCLERPEYLVDLITHEFNPVYDDRHFYTRVQVRDSGKGINPQNIPKLFSKFVHTDSTTTRSHELTGLGLAISRRFVKLMGGHVWIESEGLGKGSTVIFIVKLGFPDQGNYLEHSVAPPIQFSQGHMDFIG